MMKACVLFLLAALPALPQFGDARSLQHQPIKPGMTCASDAYVLTWVTAHGQFECLAVSGSPTGAAGGVLGGTYPSPTFAGGASFNANAATFLNGAGSFTSPGTANARITFSNVASATMTLTGVAVKAVVTCWDSSVSPARLFIPDSVEQTDADTLTFNFSPNATGYCDGSTGIGLTGATGPTGPAGGVTSVFGSTGVITTLANPTFTGTMTVGTTVAVDGPNKTIKALTQDGFYLKAPLTDLDGSALTPALAGLGAGNLSNGVYSYKFTHVDENGGETAAGTATPDVTVVDATSDGQVVVKMPYLCDDFSPIINIYRTVAGGSVYKLVVSLDYSCAVTYTDNIADASLGATAPTTNTSLATASEIEGQALTFPLSTEVGNRFWLLAPLENTRSMQWQMNHVSTGTAPALYIIGGTSADSKGGNVIIEAGFSSHGPGSSAGDVLLSSGAHDLHVTPTGVTASDLTVPALTISSATFLLDGHTCSIVSTVLTCP